jgi:hypothetical protein
VLFYTLPCCKVGITRRIPDLPLISSFAVEKRYHIDISFQETTGALLLARSPEALKAFSQQFSSREVQKTYLALVRGGCQTFPGKSGDIGVTLQADKTGKTCISTSEKGTMTYTSWELLGSSVRMVSICGDACRNLMDSIHTIREERPYRC